METFDIILLLGFQLYDDGTADKITIGRVDMAAKLWKEGVAPVIVASGGQGYSEKHDKTQADVMAALLIERGIPDEAIIREKESKTTVHNVECTQKLLGKIDLKAAVVTTDWHMKRSLLICKKHGVIAKGFPVITHDDEVRRARKRLENVYTFEVMIGWTGKHRPTWINPIRQQIIKRDNTIANADFARYNHSIQKN